VLALELHVLAICNSRWK